jgi:hypothetical protein
MSNLPEPIKFKLLNLQTALTDRSPALPNILQDIHATLKNYPENVTLLSEEDIALIVQGLSHQTQVSIVSQVSKGSKGSKSAIANIKANVADSLGL